jgi:hypothetical protein
MSEGDFRQQWHEIVTTTYDLELIYNVVFSFIIKDEPEYMLMRQHNLLLNRNIEQDGIELWTSQPSVLSFA